MIRKATVDDCRSLACLAAELWAGSSVEELEADFSHALESGETCCFLKYHDGLPVGFAQCGLRRDYVEGTESSPVGYLEAVYVAGSVRRRDFAGELVMACENWAKELGCREFASDCELDNADSLRFHLAMGFAEANRIICFRKDL